MKKLLYIFLTVLIVACSSDDGDNTNNSNDEDNNTDNTSPVISLIGSANVTVYEGDNFVDEGATATDNIDGDLTSSIIVSGIVDTTIINDYILTYSVSDAAGNSASATRNVSVVEPPVCQNGEAVYLDANGITVKACPNAQIGDTGNINGFTYTIVSEQQLRDFVNSNSSDLNRLVTTQVVSMSELFIDRTTNADINNWDVSNVSDMSKMFSSSNPNPNNFNKDISAWDVSNVTDMSEMFYLATTFNKDISAWDVSNVTDMGFMFQDAQNFNSPIGNWDVSNVTVMSRMFIGAFSFNQPIGNWDVSSVTTMRDMFYLAQSFNQPIGEWDVSNVTDMHAMFWYAITFNQDLSFWNVDNVIDCMAFSGNTPSWTLPKPNFTNCSTP